ncbi:YfhO family protein [Candidatus Gottesmanbacteria bacterium]|nr:YfhO family protein [Candidatus Gottesmanbacteria bacterium]
MEYKNAEGKEALSIDARFPPALFTIAWEDDAWRIWEYKKALPRAWFSTDGKVGIARYEPSLVELDVNSSERGMVVLSDTYYPGWVARVDGRNASVERIHDALRGIPVEAGGHTIELRYDPLSFRLGVIVSLVGLIISVAVAALLIQMSGRTQRVPR